MKKTIFPMIFLFAVMTFLTACPKKPKKPVIIPKPEIEVVPEAEAIPEPSIHGAEFQSIPELKNVYFDYNKYTITDDSKDTLESDAQYLKKNRDLKVLVEGNTCECGTNEYNLGLGQKRAYSVREYLIKLGVPGNRVATISYGEEKLVNKNIGPPDSPLCKPNRRAELKVRQAQSAPVPKP